MRRLKSGDIDERLNQNLTSFTPDLSCEVTQCAELNAPHSRSLL